MKKLNKKGFTLIELLAVIVILGVILIIAIPSISAAILNARKNTYVDTAAQLVDGVRLAALSNPAILPASGSTTTVSLGAIKLEKGSSTKSPFGSTYTANSVVQISVGSDSEYVYSICIVDGKGNGISDVTSGASNGDPIDIKLVDTSKVIIGSSTCDTISSFTYSTASTLYGD